MNGRCSVERRVLRDCGTWSGGVVATAIGIATRRGIQAEPGSLRRGRELQIRHGDMQRAIAVRWHVVQSIGA